MNKVSLVCKSKWKSSSLKDWFRCCSYLLSDMEKLKKGYKFWNISLSTKNVYQSIHSEWKFSFCPFSILSSVCFPTVILCDREIDIHQPSLDTRCQSLNARNLSFYIECLSSLQNPWMKILKTFCLKQNLFWFTDPTCRFLVKKWTFKAAKEKKTFAMLKNSWTYKNKLKQQVKKKFFFYPL